MAFHHDALLNGLSRVVRESIINCGLTFLIFAESLENILGDLHEIVQGLFVQLVGEIADDLLSVVAVDCYTKGELEDH